MGIGCAVSGLQVALGEPVAASDAAAFGYDRVRQVGADLRDHRRFVDELTHDAYRYVPGDELLTAGTHGLRAAGFGSRSAFLTSPTSGGTNWLAHATLQSGLWTDNQLRYETLITSDRLTLSGAFHRAGWRTVDIVPANTEDWPGRKFYGFDAYYDARNAGYRGPRSAVATMPDQYTLAAFHRGELAGEHAPALAEIDLVWSHWPWGPVPRQVGWADVGDGSVFADRPEAKPSPGGVRAAYAGSIVYSLRTLLSYARTHGDDDLVLVFLGDHSLPRWSPAARQAATCRSTSSPATRTSSTGSPGGAGRMAFGPARMPRCGRWPPSATGSSPASASHPPEEVRQHLGLRPSVPRNEREQHE